MSDLRPGEKRPLTQTRFELHVQHDLPGLDLSLFALSGERLMAGDESIVFYNSPALPSGGVTGRFSEFEAHFSIDLTRLGSATGIGPDTGSVERLMLTASHDEWPLKRAGHLRAEVAGLVFEPLPTLQNEKAAMLLEFYRYRGEWRVAAIGEGFAGGLADLIALFGGEVEETPAPASTRAVAALAQPSPDRLNLVKVVSLSKSLSLEKGERVSLCKEDGAPELGRVSLGLGWDAASDRNIDLDAGCLLFDAQFKHLETVFFMRLNSSNNSVKHSGDNLTGEGEGDDEVIEVDLSAVPERAVHLVFVVNSFSGHKFSDVKRAFCRLFIIGSGHELARFDLSGGEATTGMLMARLSRSDSGRQSGGWQMTALGLSAPGMTARGSIKRAQQELREAREKGG
ncbi:TerD family protein [Deinococcus alpinitundrae]|uniref:TerD family protein n=1 Tax=Deinococcus alpinitundrae TaxID=468913 RepID=UPI001379B729|nr:TerD family protein [Deinococcus alpinitundrae]